MLRGRFEAAGDLSPGELRTEYEAALAETIEAVGESAVVERVDEKTIRALVAGESPELTLEEASAILATDEQYPDAETIEAEARDILLMGMSVAVLDVEAIAAGINDELEPKEIQQKVEGRYPISLEEFAIIHSHIEREK